MSPVVGRGPGTPPVDWAAVKDVFGLALEASPDERDAVLAARCAGDAALRAAVERLLQAHDREDAAAAAPPTGGGPGADRAPDADRPGADLPPTIGPYELGEVLGEGGFGVVVRARQRAPLVRDVAIKVSKPGRDGAAVLRRFEIERDALARMSHPGIAAVLDAGRLSDGRPYVVMELVDGEPITDFAHRRGLSVRERVALVARVCRAIHHAHQRAVIHRDVKPSNVLVVEQDGEPRPRVIDFGIARALGPGAEAGRTRAGDLLGTPRYMSPEQLVAGGTTDVRTDVHGLGVVLCEVLTGSVPRDPRTVALAADREVPAEPPSRLARRTAEGRPRRTTGAAPTSSPDRAATASGRPTHGGPASTSASAAADEPSDPASAAPASAFAAAIPASGLRGDLDRIVLTAVAWDPDDRYDSAAALADDLERFLRGEPVLAVGPSAAYRVRRFVGRHAVACGLGGAAALAILAGAAAALVGRAAALDARDLAAAEAERAAFVSTWFLEDMLAAADPDVSGARDVTVAELLDVATRAADARFAEAPALRADVLHRIGTAYARVGRPDDAVPALERALAAEAVIEPRDPERRLALEIDLADALSLHPERHAEGVAAARRLEAETRARLGPDHELSMHAWLMTLIAGEVRPEVAVDRLLAMRTRLRADGRGESVLALRVAERLAIALEGTGRDAEQVEVLTELLAIAEARLGPAHSRTISARFRLGAALVARGELDRGGALLENAHVAASRLWPASSPNLLGLRNELIVHLLRAGRSGRAVEVASLASAGAAEAWGPGSIRHGLAEHQRGRALLADGRPEAAVEVLAAILPDRRRQWGAEHPAVAATMRQLALAEAAAGRWTAALATAEDLAAIARPASRARVDAAVVRARALAALDRADEASAHLRAERTAAAAEGRDGLLAAFDAVASELGLDG